MTEVEVMISEVLKYEGRPCTLKALMGRCAANVVMGMIYGWRFEHSDPEFQKAIQTVNDLFRGLSLDMEFFPLLFYLPKNRKALQRGKQVLIDLAEFARKNVNKCKEVGLLQRLSHWGCSKRIINRDR